ncbi:endoglucanase A precursor [Pseudovirgaria hyperparasitica]|uniref:Endoglucanase A n=1 Tax=Pseudovirgaria hyperparasitica TaxID=470096 RepID=A0A6A6W585_9PEZI|nr:endoglucanase A precursor [Pseudovirgaria hyperparasitica]KAF2757116.1 endoglucanase A precursor [Pseudovirgaria hyperparasitica]
MKYSTFVLLATAACGALAAPTTPVPSKTLEKRADYCGQWDSKVTGTYTIYNNLWGMSAATSGSQCTGVDSLSGSTVAWHTKWSWAGGPYSVKSYANAVVKMTATQLSKLTSLATTWKYSYSGSSLIANVAYDLFTSSSTGGSAEYEVMIWLNALGGAGPISSTGTNIATPSVAGKSWKLYYGLNGSMKVYSFVASSAITSFSGDLMDFIKYLESSQGLPSSQYLQSIGAGTEPFTGSNGVLSTTAYSVVVK